MKTRIQKSRSALRRKKVSALLITNKINITYLCGFTGSRGHLLITNSKAILFTDSRYIERAKYTVPKWIEVRDVTKETWQKTLRTFRISTIGFEGDHVTINQLKKFKHLSPRIKFKDISGEIESLRAIKSPQEIRLIKKSQQINSKTFELIKKFIQKHQKTRKPLREIDVAWEIKRIGFELGAEDVSFNPIVAFGKNSAIPHHKSGQTRLKSNDILLIDMGMKYKGYCSDMTRTILPKSPTKLQKEVYNTVAQAQKNALHKTKTGLPEQKIDSLARKVIEEAGYGEYFTHGTGHGVGLKIHESPSLKEEGTAILKPGMVVTIEPGIYLPGKFGVRIEDIIVLD
jgi:Xaa-Pro aminopeptidase